VVGHASSEFIAVLSNLGGPELSVWRFLLGGACLVLLVLLTPQRNLWSPLRDHGLRLTALSLAGVSGGYLAFHWSLDYATVPQVATTVTTIPIFVALASLWLHGQTISPAKRVTGVCAVLGVAVLMTDGYLAELAGSPRNLLGMLLAVCCAAVVATYTVMVRPLIALYGALRITALSMMIGGIGLWVIVGLAFDTWINPAALTSYAPSTVAALLTIALWNTTLTQFLWLGGLAAVPDMTRGSYLFFLKPVIAVVLTLFFLGQAISGTQLIAIGVICGSVVIEANWARLSRARISTPAPKDSD
jgi:drug/metabolite transporter (DMT)-like permease